MTGLTILLLCSIFLLRLYLQKRTADRTIERKNAVVKQLITEKEWLQNEVNHRVRNNLQVILSLLNTQSAHLDNSDAQEAIRESQNRIYAIALIHQKMCSNAGGIGVNFKSYTADLLKGIVHAADGGSRKIDFEQSVEPVHLQVDQAIPLGLILNEAVTSAMRHDFTGEGGIIFIGLRVIQPDIILFNINDSGRRRQPSLHTGECGLLSTHMLRTLSRQLGASFTSEGRSGIVLTFKWQLAKMESA